MNPVEEQPDLKEMGIISFIIRGFDFGPANSPYDVGIVQTTQVMHGTPINVSVISVAFHIHSGMHQPLKAMLYQKENRSLDPIAEATLRSKPGKEETIHVSPLHSFLYISEDRPLVLRCVFTKITESVA
jgi:hypothetical protein